MFNPDVVLAQIPGWEGARWTPLSGGLTNNSFHVTNGTAQGVLKVDDQERGAPFNTRSSEAAIQTTAAAKGLAPRVLYAESGVFLTEYVDGVVWERRHLLENDALELLAQVLQRLHTLPLSGRTFDAAVAARRYRQRIKTPDPNAIALCSRAIENSRLPQHLCCCHNDLVVENMIATPELLFLDWEYACDNNPLFDLATVIEHHELADTQVTRLLRAYFVCDRDRWRQPLAEQRQLYLSLWYLWMAQRPDSNPSERAQIAERLATSYS